LPFHRKKGEEVAAQLAQASLACPDELGCFLQKQSSFKKQSGRLKSKFENCYLHPLILINSPPFFCNLQKSYGSL